MSEMRLQMSLTLADAASGPLRAFTAQMEALKTATNTVGARLEAIAAGISSVAKASSAASGVSALGSSLSGLSAAMAAVRGEASGAATAIGAVGQRASAAGVGTYALEQAMGALGGTLSAVTARLGQIATSLAAVGTEAKAATASVNAGTASMGAGMAAANTQAGTLMTTLKGLGQVYAALKIEQGLKASAKDAIDYQATQTRMAAMGLSEGDRGRMVNAANAASRAIPQFSREETLSMAIDLRNATGSIEQALTMLQPFAVAAFNMRMATPTGKTFNESDMLLIAKALEQRNATLDPARMQAELNMFERIYTATQGRVDAQQILGNLQYAKGGLGQSMDIGFLPVFAALIEQVRNAGGNGGQIGTALTTLQQSVLAGIGNAQAQKMRAQLGLLDPTGLKFNRQGTIDQKNSDLRMAGAEEFQRNPYEWVQNYLKPALIRAGIDLADDAAVNATLNRLFPNRNAANIAGMMINRGELIEKDASNILQSKAGQDSRAVNIETAKANLEAFKAQLTNLAIVVGNTLLPVITAVAKAFTVMFEGLAAFMEAHPVQAEFMTWAAAIGAVVLAVSGFSKVFGVVLSLTGLFSGFGTAATAAGAAAETGFFARLASGFGLFPALSRIFATFGADVLAGAALIGRGFLRLIPLVGTLILAWDFAELLLKLIPGGEKIRAWFGSMFDAIADMAKAAWVKVTGWITNMFPSANAATSTGGASGSWDAGTSRAGGGRGFINPALADPNAPRPVGVRRPGAGLFDPTGGPGPSSAGSRRFANFDAALDEAKNAYRLEEDELKRHQKALDDQYKAGVLDIDSYYDQKVAAIAKGITAEVDQLAQEATRHRAQGDIAGANRAITDAQIKQRSLADAVQSVELERAQAKTQLDKDALDMKRRLLQTEGERHAAEILHAQQELEAGLQKLLLNGKITQAEADQMRQRAQAAVDAREYDKQIREAQAGYADRLSQIDIAERNGTLSETSATEQKLALQKQEAAQLDELLEKQRALYVLAEGEGGKDVAAIDKQIRANQAILQQLPPDLTAILKGTQTGFADFFRSIMSGTKGVSGAFKALGQSIFDTINNIVAKRLGDMLFDSLFGGMFGGGSAPFGAFGGGFGGGRTSGGGMGLLGNLLGGSAGSFMGSGFMAGLLAPSTIAGTSTTFAEGLAAGILPLASGTDYVPSDMLALIHKGERVMPAADNAAFTAAMQQGVRPFNNTTNVMVRGSVDQRTSMQIGREAAINMQRAMRRNA